MVETRLFGSPARTRTLALIALLEQTYPREIARLGDIPLVSVQRIIANLEREGVIATRIVGANRMVSINPRFYGAADLRALLLKYAKRDSDLESRVVRLRRRPRQTGSNL